MCVAVLHWGQIAETSDWQPLDWTVASKELAWPNLRCQRRLQSGREAGSDRQKLPLKKNTEEEEEPGLAAANKISLAATVAAVLSKLEDSFA